MKNALWNMQEKELSLMRQIKKTENFLKAHKNEKHEAVERSLQKHKEDLEQIKAEIMRLHAMEKCQQAREYAGSEDETRIIHIGEI